MPPVSEAIPSHHWGVTFQFSPDLAPGSGPFGSSSDGTFESCGPVEKMIIEVGRQCLATGGDGTGITVFNSADEDSFDVRADIPAVVGKQLFGLNLRFFRFLLLDPAATMFDSTALPASPQFAEASDFQQNSIDLIDANGVRTRLVPGGAPYALRNFSPQEDIAALIDLVNGSQASGAIKAKLNTPLQQASTLLSGVLEPKNVVKAKGRARGFHQARPYEPQQDRDICRGFIGRAGAGNTRQHSSVRLTR